ncbi:MAG: hypothetical protein KJP05_03375, partial [Deltaproteobacteria bacterium]|nr:hypothetical protein [Deltaproteobacteria bacterium]
HCRDVRLHRLEGGLRPFAEHAAPHGEQGQREEKEKQQNKYEKKECGKSEDVLHGKDNTTIGPPL